MSTKTPVLEVNSLRARLARAASAAAEAGVSALLISPGSDLKYLIGADVSSFERLTCLVIPAEGTPGLVVPKMEEPLYADIPLEELGIKVVTWVDGEDPYGMTRELVGEPTRLAVADVMPALHAIRLRDEIPGAEQVLAGPIVSQLRMVKDAAEIAALRHVGAAIDRVHSRMGEFLRAGRTEAEVSADIHRAMIEEGHERVAFIIVGSGPNGAIPHHHHSERVIEQGDVVVIDIGGPIGGYFSDCTRTYSIGEPKFADVAETYKALQDAQAAAVAAVKPGVSAQSIDRAAREPIAAAGYGEYFVHRTGHGIGLDVHEDPYIVEGNDITLQAGHAFSVEPGIYLPGRWGARIEDIVAVTENGVESFNNTTHDLVIL
ncbi:aminopeptidase P family protein [Pseudonocardiaceae bacterium YIM PH 21723]|nr:aminopeptidase P family protein [Pseudonocardiaceae bacterium YIM PH 21723]